MTMTKELLNRIRKISKTRYTPKPFLRTRMVELKRFVWHLLAAIDEAAQIAHQLQARANKAERRAEEAEWERDYFMEHAQKCQGRALEAEAKVKKAEAQARQLKTENDAWIGSIKAAYKRVVATEKAAAAWKRSAKRNKKWKVSWRKQQRLDWNRAEKGERTCREVIEKLKDVLNE